MTLPDRSTSWLGGGLLLIITAAGAPPSAQTVAATHFDAGFLRKTPGAAFDISQFDQPSPLQPGIWHLDLQVNGSLLGQSDVTVTDTPQGAKICIDKALLGQLPVRPGAIRAEALSLLNDNATCVTLQQLIPQATIRLDFTRLQLQISLPQALLPATPRDAINPLLWDDGVNSLLLGYDSNYYDSRQDGSRYRSFYSGNELSLNLNGFHFQHRGTLSWQPDQGRHYQSLTNALQHDITPLSARLTLGDADSSGYLFDSFAWRGVQLASDDTMLPDSQRGYAPVIQGVAQSTARVSVRQGSTLLYETTVPPGPFRIDDLYPTGYGGDLQVTIREANGSESHFGVPYASLPQLLRDGSSRFSITAGTLRDLPASNQPKVAQLTLQQGFSNGLTGYSGVLLSERYRALLLGGAVGTRAGALAADVSHTTSRNSQQHRQGQRYHLSYSKVFSQSNTTLAATLSRLSSAGYLDLKSAVRWQNRQPQADDPHTGLFSLPRTRTSLSLTQRLPESWGQLNLAALTQRYAGNRNRQNELQANYSNSFGSLTWSLSASRVYARDNAEMLMLVSLSLPLGNGPHALAVNMNTSRSTRGYASQAGISGSLGAVQQLDYDLILTRDEQHRSSGNLAASWRLPATTLDGSLGGSGSSQTWSAGMGGAVALVADGLTFSPWYSDTMALVSAPDATGATINGYPGLVLNHAGQALVPWLMPYRQNEIVINPQGLPLDVALYNTSQKTVPRSGALVRLDFATRRGQPVLIHIVHSAQQDLPFGASVRDEKGNLFGMVTQGNTLYVRLPAGRSRLLVINNGQPLCQLTLHSEKTVASPAGIRQLRARCQPVSPVTAKKEPSR